MKSATTASSGTPSPVMRMPVWPVARKVAAMPRARISRSMASAVYILPTEQSVPTARQRRPRAALAVGDRVAVRRHAHVVELAAVRHRRGDELRLVAQQVVQAGGEVEPGAERLGQHADPGRRDHPAAVGDADHQRPRAGGGGLGDGHVGQAQVGVAARQAELADRRVGPPVADALGDLGRQRIGRVAEEEQVGGFDQGALLQPAKSRGGSGRGKRAALEAAAQEGSLRGGEDDQALLDVALAVEDVDEAAGDEPFRHVDQAAVRAHGDHREAARAAFHVELAAAPADADLDGMLVHTPPPFRGIILF